MKILFVLENYLPHIGGVEIVFKNLCEGLVRLGHKVDIVTHRIKGTEKFENINGVNVYRVNCFYSRYWFSFLSIPKVLRLSKEADIIHTTTFNAAFPAWVGAKLLKKTSIITVHEVWVGKWKELTEMGNVGAFIHNLLERAIYSLKFDRYICVSNSTKKQLESIGKEAEKIEVVYNGVDYGHWNPKSYDSGEIREEIGVDDNNFLCLFYGRPGVSKGFECLLKAVPLIKEKIPNVKLLAILSKDKTYSKRYSYMIRLIKELEIEQDAVIHDPVDYKELPKYVKAADCVVVPSLAEGFCFTAAEACAMEKPIVASNTTSIPEVISGKYVLVEPKNPEEIAKGICSVYHREYTEKPLKRFELNENIEGYLKVYGRLLNEN